MPAVRVVLVRVDAVVGATSLALSLGALDFELWRAEGRLARHLSLSQSLKMNSSKGRRGEVTHQLSIHVVRSCTQHLLDRLSLCVVDEAESPMPASLLIHHQRRIRHGSEGGPEGFERVGSAGLGDGADEELIGLLSFGTGDGALGVDLW